jgi:hypothetical protein
MIPNPISMDSKTPRWQHSKVKGLGQDNNLAQHFENFPYPIIKHKANMNIWRSCLQQLGSCGVRSNLYWQNFAIKKKRKIES